MKQINKQKDKPYKTRAKLFILRGIERKKNKMRRKLPLNTKVKFNLAQDLDTGKAIIREIDNDQEDGHLLYKLEVVEGSQADLHRNDKGELWLNDFEVKPIR